MIYISLRSILLPIRAQIFLQVFFFLWVSLQNITSKSTFSHSGYIPCPPQISRFKGPMLYERYKLWSSSFWSLLHFPFSFHLVQNIRTRSWTLNTLSPCSSLKVRDMFHSHAVQQETMFYRCFISQNSIPTWVKFVAKFFLTFLSPKTKFTTRS